MSHVEKPPTVPAAPAGTLRRALALLLVLVLHYAIQYLTRVLAVYPHLRLPADLVQPGSWIGALDHHTWQMLLALVTIGLLSRGRWQVWGLNLRNRRESPGSLRILRGFCRIDGLYFVIPAFLVQLFLLGPPAPGHPLTAFHIAGMLVFGFLFVGLSEEIVFRGLVHTLLARWRTGVVRVRGVEMPTAGIVAALVFTLAHIRFFTRDQMALHNSGTTLSEWEACFEGFLKQEVLGGSDAAHDLEHVRRVVANAKRLTGSEGAAPEVVVPAAWLHDCVAVPKHSPLRMQASRLAAEAAGAFLQSRSYPDHLIPAIEHAVHAHSFSARVEPRTVEARVVQDADRLDALGAVGIARTLMLGGALGTPLYHLDEPLPVERQADDSAYVLDHFFTKLLTLSSTMQTAAGRREAEQRTDFMREYLRQIQWEVGSREC